MLNYMLLKQKYRNLKREADSESKHISQLGKGKKGPGVYANGWPICPPITGIVW
jgi:hypothetical protein